MTHEFDGEYDRRVQGDWHPPLLDRLFGDQIDLHHELYQLTHAHRRRHNGGRDDGPCTAWPSPPSRAPIWRLIVETTGARRFLEIGTGLGYTTALMAEAAGSGAHVDTIEIDADHADEATAQLARIGVLGSVRVLRGDAGAILPTLTEPYDVVFADGGQEDVSWHLHRLTRPGGVPAEIKDMLRDPPIDVLADLRAGLGRGAESDEIALSEARDAYHRIVSSAVDAVRG